MLESYPGKDLYYECEICHEPVTNPICPYCLAEEIMIWSTVYPDIRKALMPRLMAYLRNLKKHQRDSLICIKCKRHTVSVCTYCFIRAVLDELEALDVNRIVKKEFLQFFNYDLGHEKYLAN
jgi:hypothetical protein